MRRPIGVENMDYLITKIDDYSGAPHFIVVRNSTREKAEELAEMESFDANNPGLASVAEISGAIRDEVKKLAKELGINK